ncbi:MAG: hypothetical protein GY874_10860, partial [Desulfobacteraceae bacterium]|nr:hypothetical protein [Desulfobacteraceae bacterium]
VRAMGQMLEHNQGANYITAGQFTLLFWNIFPATMQDWLQEDQNLDPFDAANPMDHDDIADHIQRYWNIHFKRSKKNDENNQGKNKRKDGNDGNNNEKEGTPKRQHGGGQRSNKKQGRGDNNNVGRSNCSIPGHENHRHDWQGCYLNSKGRFGRFDAEAAKEFYNNEAKGPNIWYRDIYEKWQNEGGRHT